MKKRGFHLPVILLLTIVTILTICPYALSTQPRFLLIVTVLTDKLSYHYRQQVNIYGNVTYEGNLVSSGLVGIQLEGPNRPYLAFRTVPANATPSQSWDVSITSFYSSDSNGNPKTLFLKRKSAYFRVFIENNHPFMDKPVLYTITLCDIDSTPFATHWASTVIPHGANFTELVSLYIEDWVSTGNATAHANVYTDWPNNDGYPQCPEATAVFAVETMGSPPSQPPPASYASYRVAIRLPPDAQLGVYTVSVGAYSIGVTDSSQWTLYRDYELLGDIVFDRSIDIFDVVVAGSAYGTQGGQEMWNPEADLDANGAVEIFDVVIIANQYGTTY